MVEKTKQIAQLHVVSGDFEARAESDDESLYASIDEVVDKMIHQTRKYKEKQTDHAGKGHHNTDGSSVDPTVNSLANSLDDDLEVEEEQ